MPKVSVIIPTYRRAVLLKDALHSVLGQTFQDFEVIVVDDFSDDHGETRRVVESFKDERLIFLPLSNNRGPAAARNAALSLCTGEYLSFLDSDDLMTPRKLEEQVLILDSDPGIAMVYSDEYLLDKAGNISSCTVHSNRIPPLPSGAIARDFFQESFIATMTVTLRRLVFDEMSGFDENLIWNEDDDLWFRIMLKYKVVFSNYPGGIRRIHSDNMSRDREKMTLFQLQCIEKYVRYFPEFIQNNQDIVSKRILSLVLTYIRSKLRRARIPKWSIIRSCLDVSVLVNQAQTNGW